MLGWFLLSLVYPIYARYLSGETAFLLKQPESGVFSRGQRVLLSPEMNDLHMTLRSSFPRKPGVESVRYHVTFSKEKALVANYEGTVPLPGKAAAKPGDASGELGLATIEVPVGTLHLFEPGAYDVQIEMANSEAVPGDSFLETTLEIRQDCWPVHGWVIIAGLAFGIWGLRDLLSARRIPAS